MAQPRVPGEPKIDPATGLPPVLRNTDDDPNKIARDRERVLQATATVATGGEGYIAPSPAIDDGPAERTAAIDGQNVKVRLSPVRRNAHVVKYGAESKLPKGTPVNEDGTVCDNDKPYGVIGDIQTESGWLINRIIPLESLNADQAA